MAINICTAGRYWHLEKIKVLGLGIGYIPKPIPRPNTYIILGTYHVYKSTVFRKKNFSTKY